MDVRLSPTDAGMFTCGMFLLTSAFAARAWPITVGKTTLRGAVLRGFHVGRPEERVGWNSNQVQPTRLSPRTLIGRGGTPELHQGFPKEIRTISHSTLGECEARRSHLAVRPGPHS